MTPTLMDHQARQAAEADRMYAAGPRSHVTSTDPLVRYLVEWRIRTAMGRLRAAAGARLHEASRVIVLCSGEGLEGSLLCDMGFTDVTVADISPVAIEHARARDPRLKGMVVDADRLDLATRSYDLALVQDGLHHLQDPVRGFTEMLRIATVGAVFLEPHNSLAGRLIGRKWEHQGDAVNYVFRWTRRLVEDVASSYLGPDSFRNLSFAFWHHNVIFEHIGRRFGRRLSVPVMRTAKAVFDRALPVSGNQFCGMVVKTPAAP
ncbi:MAG TPA: class I SAM-dependent methyltransferase [Longimicrobium sp.]|nr:class I SAM-dependent methyltransferase [Longimicrobium sp.]